MTIEKFVDKGFWALMIAISGYGVAQLQSATSSINELNSKMAVVIEKLANQSQSLSDHELRLRRMEEKHNAMVK